MEICELLHYIKIRLKMTIEKLLDMLDKFPTDSLINFSVGQKYYDLNDIPKAKTYLEKANKLNENHLLTYLILGNIYFSEDNEDLAKETLHKGLALMPTLAAGQGQDLEPEFKTLLEEIEEDQF